MVIQALFIWFYSSSTCSTWPVISFYSVSVPLERSCWVNALQDHHPYTALYSGKQRPIRPACLVFIVSSNIKLSDAGEMRGAVSMSF